MDVTAYLERIDYHGPFKPTFETLRGLHRAHMMAVPFENLDIHLGRRIVLDEERLFDKIVCHQRGGFCYELNGLFAALLREQGFNVTMLSAGVYDAEHDCFGPEFDHLVLLVQLEERWLADVGFGDSAIEPLRLDERGEQLRGSHRAYRVDPGDGDYWIVSERHDDGQRTKSYRFSLRPRRLYDFTCACHFQQTSPDSHFTRKRVCSRATPEGRITLSDMKLIITTNGYPEERLLADEQEYAAVLKEHFGIVL